jgi:DNA-binding MarR family transcriptional regulator
MLTMQQTGSMGKLGACFLVWRRWLARGYARHGLSLKQYYLLRHLDRVEYLYPAHISDMLFCDRPTATVVIRNMEKAGWAARTRDPENGKRFRVVLTPRGREKHEAARSDHQRPESHFDPLACFDTEEKAIFDALLTKLAKHLEELPPG